MDETESSPNNTQSLKTSSSFLTSEADIQQFIEFGEAPNINSSFNFHPTTFRTRIASFLKTARKSFLNIAESVHSITPNTHIPAMEINNMSAPSNSNVTVIEEVRIAPDSDIDQVYEYSAIKAQNLLKNFSNKSVNGMLLGIIEEKLITESTPQMDICELVNSENVNLKPVSSTGSLKFFGILETTHVSPTTKLILSDDYHNDFDQATSPARYGLSRSYSESSSNRKLYDSQFNQDIDNLISSEGNPKILIGGTLKKLKNKSLNNLYLKVTSRIEQQRKTSQKKLNQRISYFESFGDLSVPVAPSQSLSHLAVLTDKTTDIDEILQMSENINESELVSKTDIRENHQDIDDIIGMCHDNMRDNQVKIIDEVKPKSPLDVDEIFISQS